MRVLAALLALGVCAAGTGWGEEPSSAVPENLYTGELLSYPGPWAFQLGKPAIILTSDEQLDGLTDPDHAVDLGLTGKAKEESLRQICERAQAAGQRTLIFAFDHFFSQYRPGHEADPRKYLPDTPEYIERIGKIGRFAAGYGVGLELSLLSPLEIGPGYQAATGESGQWLHYRKGLRDPQSGAYSVELWQQTRWSNNKGPIDLVDAGVRVFAFREYPIGGTPYRGVDPGAIVEITDTAQVERFDCLLHKSGEFQSVRIRVHGAGRADIGPLDRVLVVQQYKTPELDYFSPKAAPFLHDLVDRYVDAGVKLNGLYSDEMHIQQDWNYFGHHDHGQFALRYVTPAMGERFAALYGEQYRDLAKYMVYFCYGQEDTAGDLTATQGGMHVFGASPQAIRETALFRSRYYRLLQDSVVDLFADAKRHAEERSGHRLEARAHATWAQSPTIDRWDTLDAPMTPSQYEYTSNFVWSNTVQQASAACHDYFKWGDFLTGNGNDFAEGGWLDRDYYGLMMACSTGSINEVPYSYSAHWGMPGEIGRRRQAVVDVFGAASSPAHSLVQEMQHRDVNVLMLYPIDLVATEERFGSWMTQYAYANLITQQKLLELGTVQDGAILVKDRRYTTVATLFEPFPSEQLLTILRTLAEQGGRVIWSGPPPVLTAEGGDALTPWQALFGADYAPGENEGLALPDRVVSFEGALAAVPVQSIPTHFLPDRVYPMTPREGGQPVARVGAHCVGVLRALPGGGQALALGFRPRDDQSQSLGMEIRTWFETLNALGAYPATGAIPGVNDNTEYLSRTTDFICARFPNGATAMAPHLRTLSEGWPGGFARNQEKDDEFLKNITLPDSRVAVEDFRLNGHTVTYAGDGAVTYRLDAEGRLLAFAGQATTGITIDGQAWTFADAPLPLLAFAPVAESRRIPGGAVFQFLVHGSGEVRIPAFGLSGTPTLHAEGARPGSRGDAVPARLENGVLIVDVGATGGRWIFVQ